MVKLNLNVPESFYLPEERCGFTVTAEAKKQWAVILDLLSELLRVCEKHNLNIYISDGSLLGVVRHGGMIPWDDDIDTVMLREDYNKLCEIAAEEFTHPYFFQTESSDPGSMRGHAQLRNSDTTGILKSELDLGLAFNQGIFIDIFPLDNLPDDPRECERFKKELIRLRNKKDLWNRNTTRYKKTARKGLKSKLKNIAAPLFGKTVKVLGIKNPYFKKMEKLKIKYNSVESKYVADCACVFLLRGTKHRKENFTDSPEYKDFEFIKVPVPDNYEEMLSFEYGNWKEFVVGTSVHGNTFFDVNRPYTEYIGENIQEGR